MRNKKEFFNAEKRKQIKKKKDLTRSLDNQVKISQRKQNKKDKERETGKKMGKNAAEIDPGNLLGNQQEFQKFSTEKIGRRELSEA